MNQAVDPTVHSACSGHRPALQLLLCEQYDRLARRIATKIPSSLADRLTVEDVLQETFLHAIRDIKKCQATTRGQFAAWLSTIADNRIVDLARAAGRKKRGGDRRRVRGAAANRSSVAQLVELMQADQTTASGRMAKGEAARAIHVGLASLPEAQRKAIELRFLQGNDLQEIAQQMGTTPGAVRGLLYRARQALRDTMGQSSRWFRKKQ